MTAAEAIARVKASCAPWWPKSFAEFNVQKEGRFRCVALQIAVTYAWHADHEPGVDYSRYLLITTSEADRCTKACRVCKKHERLAPMPKVTS